MKLRCIHEPKCYIQKYIDMYNETTMYPEPIETQNGKDTHLKF